MNRRSFLSLMVALAAMTVLPRVAAAEDDKLVVVLPFDRRNAALTQADVALVEEAVRSSAGNALSSLNLNVVTNDTALALLKERKVDLDKVMEADSSLSAAKAIGAAYFISGVITSAGVKRSGQVRFFRTEGGKLLASAEIGGQSADGLKQSFKRKQAAFFETVLSAIGVQPAPVATVKATPAKVASVTSDDDATDDQGGAKAEGKKESARLKRLCDRGDGAACVARGKLYYVGDVVRSNRATAAAMFAKGCDAGAAFGCTALGKMYADGDYVEQDRVKAVAFFKRGCDGGDKDGCSQSKASGR